MAAAPMETCSVGEEEQAQWARLGGKELEAPLRTGSLALVRADWLVGLAESGGVLRRRQELPAEAFVGLEELQRAGPAVMTFNLVSGEWLRIIVLSYPWLQPGHPDPHGESLQLVAQALKCYVQDSTYYENGGKPYGVLIDFASLPQAPRTEAEKDIFKNTLPVLNLFYAHPNTVVLKVTTFPEGYPNDSKQKYELPEGANTVAYGERGWCFAESAMSGLVKDSNKVLDLSKLPQQGSTPLWLVIHSSMAGREAPLHPTDFEAELQKKIFTCKKADFEKVAKLYEGAFERHLRGATELNYSGLGWKPDDVRKLVQVLKVNSTLETLNLKNNGCSPEGSAMLAEVLEDPKCALRSLNLEANAVGAEGAVTLGRVLRSNSSLRFLALAHNRIGIGKEGLAALGEALAANASLQTLILEDNRIDDEGAPALAKGLVHNKALLRLDLKSNYISEMGAAAFAEAFNENSTLELLDLERNFQIPDDSWLALFAAVEERMKRGGGRLLIGR